MGNSRGRWEGDKVVVETTNFTDKTHFRGSFDGRHMVERYTRVDANTVNYEFTVEDPSTWEKPWSAAYPLRSLGSLMDGVDGMQIPQMFEYACHEGNYGLTGRPRFLCCVILAKSEHFLDESDESDKEESLMHPRLPVTIAVLALLGSITLCATQSAAQSASPSANTVTTPWGDPDLQGVWDFRTITPLERPDELAGKAVLTEEEAAEWQRDWANEQNRDRRDGAGTNEVASDGRSDVARAYNEFWWDRGTDIVSDRRTSLIVDPPDGRIPALSPEGERKAEIRAAERRGWTATDIDRRGPADGPENRGCLRAVHFGFQFWPTDDSQRIQQQCPRRAGPRLCRSTQRDGAQRTHCSAGRSTTASERCASVGGGLTRSLGRHDAGRRHKKLHKQDPSRQGRRVSRKPASRRALHPRRRRHLALRVHIQRRDDVGTSVDRCGSYEAERRPAVRVLVPRGKLRDDEPPRRRARRRAGRGERIDAGPLNESPFRNRRRAVRG